MIKAEVQGCTVVGVDKFVFTKDSFDEWKFPWRLQSYALWLWRVLRSQEFLESVSSIEYFQFDAEYGNNCDSTSCRTGDEYDSFPICTWI